jgi:alkylation response protein AidB-like acyl-CoA dehydrogenase
MIGGFALTEKDVGSDATNVKTTAKPVEGGYLINGNKRWIGNGNMDVLIVWAKNTENKKFEGFIVENQWKGVTTSVIKNKMALRIV